MGYFAQQTLDVLDPDLTIDEQLRALSSPAGAFHFSVDDTDKKIRVFFFQAEDGIRVFRVTGVQTCALPIFRRCSHRLAGFHRCATGGRPRSDAQRGERSEERRVGKECRSRWSPYV